ncbi:MAG: hypothetical protein WCS31_07770 [Verrucomicrobiae bacterium]
MCASAQTGATLLPEGREPVALRPGERNPFTQKAVQYEAVSGAPEPVSEESRLRRILSAVKISGLSGGNGKFQVLLGSLIIKPGDTLPPLIGNQTERLRVTTVDTTSLTLSFIEKDPAANARQIVLRFNTRPEISRFMYGEAVEELTKLSSQGQSQLPPLESPAVAQILKESQDVDLKNMTERKVKLMGEAPDAKKSEK